MPYPVQTVNAFSEAELWYMYQQLVEINGSSQDNITQLELFQVFNGTSPQGQAISLFNQNNGISIADQLSETLSGADITISNLLVETLTGNENRIANVCQNTKVNTDNISTYLSTIRTPEIISATGSGTIAVQVHNISVANVGSAVGTITVNGTTVNLPVGATVSYDAGGNNNRFAINKFSYNGTGTTLLIQYVS